MPLDFPSSPSLNQIYSSGGKSWVWNGSAWKQGVGSYAPAGHGHTSSEISNLPGGFNNMAVFTSSGTWTVPSGVTKCKVIVTGGGGAVASLFNYPTGSGGGGGTAIKIVTLSGGSATITVGSGGVAAISVEAQTLSATSGGQSKFVYDTVTITANGGSGTTRTMGSSGSAGSGGTASGGDINITGGGGSAPNNSAGVNGIGGGSFWCSGTKPVNFGTAYGCGAGAVDYYSAVNGAAGIVVIEY